MVWSTRKHTLIFILVGVFGLPFAYYFASPFDFWTIAVLYGLGVVCWSFLTLIHVLNTARYGAQMTFDEIMRSEQDPVRLMKLIRYHIGWTPGKIASVLNRNGSRNQDGLPWTEDEVMRVVKRVSQVYF